MVNLISPENNEKILPLPNHVDLSNVRAKLIFERSLPGLSRFIIWATRSRFFVSLSHREGNLNTEHIDYVNGPNWSILCQIIKQLFSNAGTS